MPRGYLFFGDEDYLKSHALRAARSAVCPDPSLGVFNDIRTEALSYTPEVLLSALSTLPMMSEKKLVELTGLDFGSMKQSDLDGLCDVLALLPEYDYNTLIISCPSGCFNEGYLPKKPSALLRRLAEYLTPVYFPQSTPAMLNRWLAKHFAANGVTADAGFCSSLISFCGQDMFRLSTETDKLCWYALSHGRTEMRNTDLTAAVSDITYDTFAFTNAIMEARGNDALDILLQHKKNKTEPTVIMAEIIRVLCEMASARLLADNGKSTDEISRRLHIHEYRIKLYLRTGASKERLNRALSLCADTDAALKLSPNGYIAIERLICAL